MHLVIKHSRHLSEQHIAVIGTSAVCGAVVLLFSAVAREVYLVHLDFDGGALLAVFLKGGASEVADHSYHLALGEHIVNELGIVIPCGAVEEVGLGLVLALALGAFNGDAELAEGCLACVAEFGIGSKSACFDYDVGHSDYLPFRVGVFVLDCDYIILDLTHKVKYNFEEKKIFVGAQQSAPRFSIFPGHFFTNFSLCLTLCLIYDRIDKRPF